MKTLRLLTILLAVGLCTELSSCGNKSQDLSSIIGTWQEYRADTSDDYGLSTWKFNSDGSGLFIVEGITNTQKVGFTWESSNNSTIKININGEESTFKQNNGLLIENSVLGSVVFKKQ
ncbi:hypothetical protein [Mediterranea massiliensis]|uniref:hypothetical protein n=1 Tax=Mediterranea massiliensis TaxID=1841865 RepID=UPI000934B576|nr:hypothetical protein [Mediterranea massiliensis]